LLVGFSRAQDAVHAQNESYGLDQFEQGMVFTSLMLDTLTNG